MNTTHRRSAWGIALAAVALTATTACGTEIATAPGSIGDAADPHTSQSPRACFGSADYAERACADKGGPGGGLRPPSAMPDN